MLTCHLLLILLIENASAASNNLVDNGKKVKYLTKCLKRVAIYRYLLLFLNIEHLVSLNQDIRLLRDENKNQNMEIALLKEMVKSQDERVNKKIISEIEQRMKYDESSVGKVSSSSRVRQKRPFRLIPIQKEKIDLNEHKENSIILHQRQKTTIFYGPPTYCSDLSRLGYTLNGYYLVKTNAGNEVINLKGIYCAFKQPEGSMDSSRIENPIGVFKAIDDSIKSEPSSSYKISNLSGMIVSK